MFKIVAFIPNTMDGTSFYRGMGPLTELMHHHHIWVNEQEIQVNWATLRKYDAVFMQRPFTDQHMLIAKIAYDNGIPLWLDFDDDLFNVPPDNPTHGIYNNDQVKKNVATMTSMANVVTVSTAHLAQRLQPLNGKIVIVPNALDEHLLKWRPIVSKKKPKLVVWRGSNTHHKDLGCVGKELIELSHEHLDVTWEFIGYNPWFITENMPPKNVIVAGTMDVTEYFRFLGKTKPGIGVVPLFPNIFNKSKSNIAWLEMTFCGAACLVPAWDEWQKPGALTYSTPSEFKDGLKSMFLGKNVDLGGMVQESWNYILDCLMLHKINEARLKVLSEITGKEIK